jgi:hypothetical protein
MCRRDESLFYFWFEILHKCKNKYEKQTFYHFFGRKKSLDLQKIEK